MKSDVMHSRVPDGPLGQGPKDNQTEIVGAQELHSEKTLKRTLIEPMILSQVNEVRETVATDVEFRAERPRSFGVVSLWNIRRNSRYAGHPRKKPTIITGLRG